MSSITGHLMEAMHMLLAVSSLESRGRAWSNQKWCHWYPMTWYQGGQRQRDEAGPNVEDGRETWDLSLRCKGPEISKGLCSLSILSGYSNYRRTQAYLLTSGYVTCVFRSWPGAS